MEGIIVNFRRGRHTQKNNQMIIEVAGMTKDQAKDLLGKKVTWHSPGKAEINGIVKKEHGNKGALRAIFERGMPGQSIGTKVTIQ